MGRLANDLSWALGKKPRSVIYYLDPNRKLTEIPYNTTTLQGAKNFEMQIKGEDDKKKWRLIHPPIKDELGRNIYICPYNSMTNLDIDSYGKLTHGQESDYWQEQFNTLLNYLEPALAKEWATGVEWERRRQEGKKDKKKGFPIATMLIIFGIVFVIVIFGLLGAVYFMA